MRCIRRRDDLFELPQPRLNGAHGGFSAATTATMSSRKRCKAASVKMRRVSNIDHMSAGGHEIIPYDRAVLGIHR
jgi:hypothetical protein